jgi:hypothetical protein
MLEDFLIAILILKTRETSRKCLIYHENTIKWTYRDTKQFFNVARNAKKIWPPLHPFLTMSLVLFINLSFD